MTANLRQSVSQVCPNCGKVHDTSIYVSGQRVLCSCGIRFDVLRTDVSMAPPSKNGSMVASGPLAPRPVDDGPPVPDAQVPPAADDGTGPTVAPPSRKSKAQGNVANTEPGSTIAPTIPGYELIEVLGRGGMGEVWRARQVSLGRPVAVKLLPPKLATDPEFVARFDKEATALASLSHPNITQIIDRGVAGDHYYFVMELVPGKSLREIINAGRPAPADALKLAIQVCKAIEHAHEQHIVHRDLKPENILVDDKGHVKVVDFGLAGMRGGQHRHDLTATAVAMGTVNYMAPEQRRDAKHVDHRADIYSLGVVLYELLTGELPIGRFKLPTQRVGGVPHELDELVAQLLETEPEGRPERAGLVTRALEAALPLASVTKLDSYKDSRVATTTAMGRALSAPSAAPQRHTGFIVAGAVLLGMALFAEALKLWPSNDSEPVMQKAPDWYRDTEDELFATLASDAPLRVSFSPMPAGQGEELNAHAGMWQLNGGALTVQQYGDATDAEQPRLVPRAYVAHRYYSADDFAAEVDMQLSDLSDEFATLPANVSRYAELAFRIKDTQVSVFAIPGAGMRLSWRYFTPQGAEVVGNSARDVDNLTQDEVRVPNGRFRVKLSLKKLRNGDVSAEAFVDRQPVAHKVLPGLAGQVGKIAVGCRNAACRFDDLAVFGKAVDRPALSKVAP